MKTSEIFCIINIHLVTKIHRFLTDICEKKFHGSLILLQNSKIKFLVNSLILISILSKNNIANESQEKFAKTLVKKKTISFLLVF